MARLFHKQPKKKRLGLYLLCLAGLLTGCHGDFTLPPTVPPAIPSYTPPAAATPTPPLLPDSGWELLQPGLERRNIFLLTEEGQPYEQLYLLRFAPTLFQFDVAYRPGQPQTLTAWQAETGALAVINGGYFTPEFTATGLIVVNGRASGVSYGDFAGMFVITSTGETPQLRWLAQQPYDPAEPLHAALQSFPMLVKPGGHPGYTEPDNRPARRTVVAQDRQGRIIFLAAGWGTFTLYGLSQFLSSSDLDIQIALNLDGGASTGILLAQPAEGLGTLATVPTVITVHAR
ncbi:MAG: phosphodiester glycosidase family protein [Candidatus Promineifilaceae bacterium]